MKFKESFYFLNIIIIIIIIIFSIILFSNYVSAFEAEINLSTNNINIYNEDVNLEINIYNNTDVEQLYSIIPHINPFNYYLERNIFRLQPKEQKKVILIIKPIVDSLLVNYSTKLEITSNFSSVHIPLEINQNTNKSCNIEVDYVVVYNLDIKKYILDLKLKNKDNNTKFIKILSNKDLSIDINNEIKFNASEYKEIRYVFDSNLELINLKYNCDNINLNTITIDLPINIKEENNINTKNTNKSLSGLLNLGFFSLNINNILNSLFVQIILIIILIILILSFTTKYIKFIYNK
jgi:hypothetical protein